VRHCLRHEEQPRKKNRLIAQEEEKQPKNHRGGGNGERENLKEYVHKRESNLKIPPNSFQPSLFPLGAFAKSNKKLKTTSERDTQLELLGV